jgi:hypothetical protein
LLNRGMEHCAFALRTAKSNHACRGLGMKIQRGFDFTQTAANWYWERRNKLNAWFHHAKEQAELDDIRDETTIAIRQHHLSCVQDAWDKVCCYLSSVSLKRFQVSIQHGLARRKPRKNMLIMLPSDQYNNKVDGHANGLICKDYAINVAFCDSVRCRVSLQHGLLARQTQTNSFMMLTSKKYKLTLDGHAKRAYL